MSYGTSAVTRQHPQGRYLRGTGCAHRSGSVCSVCGNGGVDSHGTGREEGARICLSYMLCPGEAGGTVRSPSKITNECGGGGVSEELPRYVQSPSRLQYLLRAAPTPSCRQAIMGRYIPKLCKL